MSILKNLVVALKNLWAKEPTRVVAVLASVIVFVASNFGIVLDETSVLDALGYVVPILVGGEVVRSQVTPTK